MTIKIQTQKPEIPVEIGDLKFAFEITDEAIENYHKNVAKITDSLTKVKDDDVEGAKDILRKAYELFLGEGSFDAVYEITPSVVICMQYLYQIAEGIDKELKARGIIPDQNDLISKYLGKNNPVKKPSRK